MSSAHASGPLHISVDFAMSPDALALLREGTSGHHLIIPEGPTASAVSPGPAASLLDADIAFGQPHPLAVAQTPSLKWVHITSSSITRYDNPDFRALATGRAIAVSNSASVYNEACADHVFAFLLAQSRQLPLSLDSDPAPASPDWFHLRGLCVPLRGQSALILGYGAIGRRLVELLQPYDMTVTAYRRRARGDEPIPVVTDLPAALAAADHVIDILPDSAETRHFFDAARFAQMKPGSVFYNIGRGSTVDQSALEQALASRHLSAAWLDVTDPEPFPLDHPLRAFPNCHITPHVAGGHARETHTLVRHFLANFHRYLAGHTLQNRVM